MIKEKLIQKSSKKDERYENNTFIYVDDKLWSSDNKKIGKTIELVLDYFMDNEYMVKSIELSVDNNLKIKTVRLI